MADFCKECHAYMFGNDMGENDMAGITTPEDTANGLYANVLCEGCGPTQVDHEGRCIHHTKEEHYNAILKGVVPN